MLILWQVPQSTLTLSPRVVRGEMAVEFHRGRGCLLLGPEFLRIVIRTGSVVAVSRWVCMLRFSVVVNEIHLVVTFLFGL